MKHGYPPHLQRNFNSTANNVASSSSDDNLVDDSSQCADIKAGFPTITQTIWEAYDSSNQVYSSISVGH